MLGGAALMSSAGARAVELAGVQFPQQVNVAGKPLQLNGAGVRYKAVFKVYAAGLYVPAKTGNVFVLDRRNGALVVPAPELPVPQGADRKSVV